ncbi:PDC sensor domain-containing protein [Ureibacillus sp. MALMAid1270]|uniref:PDC sensor domain-containing protein n=1 Tax=Ureibacillus sp. MALMAid1270 TaxID=3411629 RepID=UPI003BA78CD2
MLINLTQRRCVYVVFKEKNQPSFDSKSEQNLPFNIDGEIQVAVDQEIAQMAIENKDFVNQVTNALDDQHTYVEKMHTINYSLTATSNELQSLVNPNVENIVIDQNLVNQIVHILSKHVQTDTLLTMDPNRHQVVLDAILVENPHVETIWTNRMDGTFIYSNPKAALVNAKMRPWFLEATQGREYISDPYISAVTKNIALHYRFQFYMSKKLLVY